MKKMKKTNFREDSLKKILSLLDNSEYLSASEISEKLKIDKRTATAWTSLLEGLGLICSIEISTGKRFVKGYKISDDYIPIWNTIKKLIEKS
jgi:DNA-binding transcriptional ArsR family regulator